MHFHIKYLHWMADSFSDVLSVVWNSTLLHYYLPEFFSFTFIKLLASIWLLLFRKIWISKINIVCHDSIMKYLKVNGHLFSLSEVKNLGSDIVSVGINAPYF